ncbi:tRNA preQ1(34) S-adenosylmethionine ribosyltransferase-isomerase QueA [Candidatus Woesearchaeota archaeon]|nr:tRNA preQ1(34) S-adenosylmethionine ribosyltransferase-isomerase QueA [Candidatus Woesearchaeota archaeon]
MNLSDFDYFLPKQLIAQKPITKRDESRLMIVSENKIQHKRFRDIADYFSKGDVVVVNDTKVFPAKLIGKKETGGTVRILLVRQNGRLSWECMVQGKNLNNKKIIFNSKIHGTIINKNNKNHIIFRKNIWNLLDKIGKTPLPPYIKSDARIGRYNTVYSINEGSIAAPTAGLHFTKKILGKLRKKGVVIAPITLHVGPGTFLPVKSENIEGHRMHPEFFSISRQTADKINNRKGRLFAVGTTSIRALESCAENGNIIPKTGETSLFIYPGYKWKLNYAGLITNFHLPKSTLLMLVCTFMGKELIFRAYNAAIRKKYRFYSFGDAMLLLKS